MEPIPGIVTNAKNPRLNRSWGLEENGFEMIGIKHQVDILENFNG